MTQNGRTVSETPEAPDPFDGWAGWATPDQVMDGWADAPLDRERLHLLMASAQRTCEEYAPALPAVVIDGVPVVVVPANYTLAVVMQTRAWGEAAKRESDVIGFGDGFAIRARPLSADVKALLRPKRGTPVVL